MNVNAGSNSVSAFAVTPRGLHLIGTASSGGTDPNSVAIAGDHLVYVLNAGSETIAGFRVGDGGLRPIPGSVRPLGAGALVPRQIQFTTDASVLVVDEGASNTIDTFVVGSNEKAGQAITTPSVGGAPSGSTSTAPITSWSPTPRSLPAKAARPPTTSLVTAP